MKLVIIKAIKEVILPELKRLEEQINEARNDIKGINYKLDAYAQRLDGFSQRLDGMDHKIDGLNAKDEAIKYLIDELRRSNKN